MMPRVWPEQWKDGVVINEEREGHWRSRLSGDIRSSVLDG